MSDRTMFASCVLLAVIVCATDATHAQSKDAARPDAVVSFKIQYGCGPQRSERTAVADASGDHRLGLGLRDRTSPT